MKKILFYYHHHGGLGHGTRIKAICKALKKQDNNVEIIVVNSGRQQPELNIKKYAKIINLPSFDLVEGLFPGFCLNDNNKNIFVKRNILLNNIIKTFNPDIAIFEHFPFGRSFLEKEIIKFIINLKLKGCKIISFVRDIIDQNVNNLSKNLKLFQAVLIHSDKDMGFKTSFEIPDTLQEKSFFTGRVYSHITNDLIDPSIIKSQLKSNEKKLIVISIGGGNDGYKIIRKLLEIKRELDKHMPSLFLISTGTSIPDDIFDDIFKLTKNINDVKITKFNLNLIDYINAADLSISMGGYNSVNNALLTRTPTLFFPRQTDSEQELRCNYYSNYFSVLNYNTISNSDLLKKIKEVLSLNKINIDINENGAERTARFLLLSLDIKSIKVRLTTLCNLNCDMCSWKKCNIYNIDFDLVKKIIVQAKLIGCEIINFTGGEPTLYDKINYLLEFVKSKGLKTSLSTNGNFIKHNAVHLASFLDYVDISIDSHNEEINDKIRDKQGAFKEAIKSAQIFYENNVNVHINVTVRPDNYEGIYKMVNLLSSYIHSISFTLVDPGINNLKYLIFTKNELENFYFDEVPKILKNCIINGIKIRISPFFSNFTNKTAQEILLEYLFNKEEYIHNLEDIFNVKDCSILKESIRINSNNNITSCCFLDDSGFESGDLNKNDLSYIITSDLFYNMFKSNNCSGCLRSHIYAKYFKNE